ncbi:hypothetical protein [Piscirickettsia salmonis]|uniref:hypothetical protein n=1 Tax=Piscirickettsia salmonis TaxID=1238 RepID=UPI0007C96339|nr:hypothetical protein A0O36_01614 [Piscirickettsiaceae bacterium NZ-RLO1]
MYEYEISLEQLPQCTKFIVNLPKVNQANWYFRCERNLLIVDFYLQEDNEYIMLSRPMAMAKNLIITTLDIHQKQLQALAKVSYGMIKDSGALKSLSSP